MDYTKLSFRQLQQEAKKLGIHPIGGKGIDKPYLLDKITQKLTSKAEEEEYYKNIKEERARKQQEQKEREEEIAHLIEESTNIIPSTEAEEILLENNEDLYRFLFPVIDKVPSLRQEKYAGFEENPWNLVLDELNAMNELDYDVLNVLVNGDENYVSYLIAMEKERLFLFFEQYPILSYSIVYRRRPEDPWIINAVIISEAYRLYPHSNLIEEPLYREEEFHPFSRFFLVKNVEEADMAMHHSYEYIRKNSGTVYDEGLYLLFLKVLEHVLTNVEKINTSSILSNYYYYFFQMKPEMLPLTEEILFSYFSIYKKLKSEDAPFFRLNITPSIFLPHTPLPLFEEYVRSTMFFDHMTFLIDVYEKKKIWVHLQTIETHIGMNFTNIFNRDDDAAKILIKALKEYEIPSNIMLNLSSYFHMNIKRTNSISENIYAKNLVLFANSLNMDMTLFIKGFFGYIGDYYSPILKEKILRFLSIIVKEAKNKEEVKESIRNEGKKYLSSEDINQLLHL